MTTQLLAADLGEVDLWDDRRIGLGQDWHQEIQASLDEATVVILMISANFLISKYIKNNELPKILKLHYEKNTKIYPIVVRHCAWEEHAWLKKFQFYKPLTPLQSLRVNYQEKTLSEFAREIKREGEEDDL